MSSDCRSGEEFLKHLLGESGNEPVDKDVEKVEIELPSWYDAELFKKGQKGYFKYTTGMSMAMLAGLLSVLAIPSILRVLICSKKTGTPMDAYRRYIRTMYHVVAWHKYELKPDSKALQSITIVRKTHLAARTKCEHLEQITITQRDMALTQFGFLGFIILRPHALGIPNEPELMEAVVHVWRVIGYLLGIKEEFNLCTDSLDTTKERLQLVMDRVYRPAIQNGDERFDFMCKAIIDGLWHSDLILYFRPYMCFFKRMVGIKGYECLRSDFEKSPDDDEMQKLKYRELTWLEQVLFFYYIIKYEYLYPIVIFRILYNIRAYVVMLFGYYLPLVAMYDFGIKRAYVRIFCGKSTEPNKHYG